MNSILKTICCIFLISSICVEAQEIETEKTSLLEDKIVRINLLSPGFGVELKTGKYSSLSLSAGVTNSWLYPTMNDESHNGEFGFVYSIEPFINVNQKFFYNLNKRLKEGKNLSYNSGNFISIRSMALGSPFAGNITRKNDYQFYLIPSWGIQRSYNRIHFLFDVGSLIIFDGKGNSGFFPIFPRVNIGYNF